ncbi:MAG: Two-component system response regulator [Bacilli bacterium]|nr:Two-component system response regulator [Bacilli bacterium]
MKLTAMLVDDEPNILRNLESIIPWGTMGIEVIGRAKNGQQALDIARKQLLDIILIDIRMPIMDGITFLKHLREFNQSAAVMIITGYQDFEYARSVLQYDVYDYILKPINYKELISNTEKIALKIRAKKRDEIEKKKKWGRVINLAYEKILYDAIMDYTTVNTKYELSEDELDLEEFSYIFLFIDLDNYTQLSLSWSEKQRKLWNFAVRNVLQDVLTERDLKFVILQLREGEWCVLIEQDTQILDFDVETTKNMTDHMQYEVNKYVHLKISIGIYTQLVSFTELAKVYKKLQQMMQLSPSKEESLLVGKDTTDHNDSLWHLIETMVSGLKQSDKEKTEHALEKLNAQLAVISEQSFIRAEEILYFLVLHLVREMREVHMITIHEEEMIWKNMSAHIGVEGYIALIKEIIANSINAMLKKKNSRLLMNLAEDYIHRHLDSNFGIEEICHYLGISPSYFSLLFKQQYGETFVEYLSKQRIERAKSMLILSDKSITQIGNNVGFYERRYFTSVFQKYTGETPSEYRDKHKQN